MSADRSLLAHVVDLLGDDPALTTPRLFSGWSLRYADEPVGMIVRGTVYAKAAPDVGEAWRALGSTPFTYTRGDRTITMAGYWSVPPDGLERGDALRDYLGLPPDD